MRGCRKFQQLVTDAVYEDLAGQDQMWFDDHRNACKSCAELYQGLKSTLTAMDSRERVEPEPEFWQSYWDNLEPKLVREQPAQRPEPIGRIVPVKRPWFDGLFNFQPRFAFQFAGGLALVLVGILIGKSYFVPEVPVQQAQQTVSAPPIQPVNLTVSERTDRYLQRSKVLLMGVVNYDEGEDDLFALDFDRQRTMSQDLIQEAVYLKDELDDKSHQHLHRLISDLELILMQIANIEAEYDLPDVELVRSAVQSQAVFLRMNLEEMREETRDVPAKHDSQPKQKETI